MKTLGKTITIPRNQYEAFRRWQVKEAKRLAEEKEADAAIADYLKAKKAGKLKVLKSLADLR